MGLTHYLQQTMTLEKDEWEILKCDERGRVTIPMEYRSAAFAFGVKHGKIIMVPVTIEDEVKNLELTEFEQEQ